MADNNSEMASPGALRAARVALTGRFVLVSREHARELLQQAGAKITSAVTRATTHLIVGCGGWPLLADGTIPHGLKRAEALNRQGGGPQILAEAALLEELGLRSLSQRSRAYPLEEAQHLVGIDAQTMLLCESLGLVRSQNGWLDFQDLVSLRTVVSLIRSGVRIEAISESVHRLANLVPGLDRPLAQFEMIAAGRDQLLARRDGVLMAPDGQLVLEFEPQPDPALAHPGALARIERGADQWHATGENLEEQGRFEEAAEAYRRAIAINPNLAEAHFNLGNVLRTLEQLDAAEQSFRDAALAAPMPEAWYNLADLLDERGRIAEAIDCLQHALALDNTFADAHFNLAIALEQQGNPHQAAHHRQHYEALVQAIDSTG